MSLGSGTLGEGTLGAATGEIPPFPEPYAPTLGLALNKVHPRALSFGLTVNKFTGYAPALGITVNKYGDFTAGETRYWKLTCSIGGASQITGQCRIQRRLNQAALCDVQLLPSGAVDVESYIDQSISIGYQRYSGGVLIGTFALFVGKIVNASFDVRTKIVSLTASDQMQEKLRDMTTAQIDVLIPSYRTTAIYPDLPESNYDYAMERLKSAEGDIYVDGEGVVKFKAWAAPSAGTTFDKNNIIDGTLVAARENKKGTVNTIEIKLQHRYLFGWQRQRRYKWYGLDPVIEFGGGIFFRTGPARQTIEAAIPDDVVFVEDPGFGTAAPTAQFAAVDMKLAQRWTQRVVETYTVRVKAPTAVAAYGEKLNKTSYAIDTDESEITFDKTEQITLPDMFNRNEQMRTFGKNWGYDNAGLIVAPTSNYAVMPGSAHIAYGSAFQRDSVIKMYGVNSTPAKLTEALECSIAEARREILNGYRQNGTRFDARFALVSLGDDATALDENGIIDAVTMAFDVTRGDSRISVQLASFMPSGGADDGIIAPASSLAWPSSTYAQATPQGAYYTWAQLSADPPDERVPAGVTPPSFMFDAPPSDNSDWAGFIGNWYFYGTAGIVVGANAERFVIDFPAIDDALRDDYTAETTATLNLSLP